MVKKYVEVTVAVDDASPEVVEVSYRQKVDEEPWSEPSETEICATTSTLGLSGLSIQVKKE